MDEEDVWGVNHPRICVCMCSNGAYKVPVYCTQQLHNSFFIYYIGEVHFVKVNAVFITWYYKVLLSVLVCKFHRQAKFCIGTCKNKQYQLLTSVTVSICYEHSLEILYCRDSIIAWWVHHLSLSYTLVYTICWPVCRQPGVALW